ncbi:MAG TPA: hypothetical protein VK911_18110, partial [Vicinamibacterales bacterium]|nr:hypothetical protein [Vicinamibacterales bacterium]
MRPHALLAAAVAILGAAPAAPASASRNLVSPSCWEAFAPRPANAPASARSMRAGDTVLTLASEGRRFVYGGWRCRVDGIDGGSHYQLRALALPVNVESVRESLTVLLRWKGDFGDEVAPSYAWQSRPVDRPEGAVLFDRRVQAPPKARGVEVELVLQWSEGGQVTWQEVS